MSSPATAPALLSSLSLSAFSSPSDPLSLSSTRPVRLFVSAFLRPEKAQSCQRSAELLRAPFDRLPAVLRFASVAGLASGRVVVRRIANGGCIYDWRRDGSLDATLLLHLCPPLMAWRVQFSLPPQHQRPNSATCHTEQCSYHPRLGRVYCFCLQWQPTTAPLQD